MDVQVKMTSSQVPSSTLQFAQKHARMNRPCFCLLAVVVQGANLMVNVDANANWVRL